MAEQPTTTKPRTVLQYSKPLVIGVFLMLYSYQGFLFGLNEAVKLLLKDKGAADSDLAVLSLTTSPFYLKFIIAPFMDVYYSKWIGKRMTWILPISLVASFLFFAFADSIEAWIESKDFKNLAILIFLQFVIIAIQDVAIDGMVCEILNEEDFEKGSLIQTLGQTVGPFLCCNVFILIVSPKFGKETLGLDSELVSIPVFIRFLGVLVIASSIFSAAVVNEKGTNILQIDSDKSLASTNQKSSSPAAVKGDDTQECNEMTFSELMSLIPRMFTQKHIRNLQILPAIFEVFLLFTDSNCFLKLLDKGFDLLYLNEFEMYFFVLDLIVLVILGKMNILENLWKYYRISVDVLFLNAVFFWIAFYFLPLEFKKTWMVYLVVYKLVRYLSSIKFTASSVFIQFVADKSCGGSYLTIVYSCHNFCRMNIPAALLRLTKVTGFVPIVMGTFAYDLMFRLLGYRNRWIAYFDSTAKSAYALKTSSDMNKKLK